MTTKNKTATTVPATTAQPGDQLPVTSSYADYTPASEVLDVEKAFPVLQILHYNSGATKKSSDVYVEGAEPGMIFCRADNALWAADTGVVFVPCAKQHVVHERTPFKDGWERKGTYSPNDPIFLEAVERSTAFGQYTTPEGNDLVETFYLFGYLLDDNGAVSNDVILAIDGKKITPYKKFFARIKRYRHELADGSRVEVPMFAHRIRITTLADPDTSKGDFFNYRFDFLNGGTRESIIPEDSPLLELGAKIEAEFKAGRVTVGEEETDAGEANTTATPAF